MIQQIWFITGSSRGFGRALVSAALDAGDSVVATARRPEQLADFVERYGERVLPVALDVTSGAAAQAAIEAAVSRFGRIDVLVNNPGYANIARSKLRRKRTSVASSRRTSGASTTSRRPRCLC